MIKVFSHESLVYVNTIKGLLLSENVDVIVKNEFVGGAAGEVPIFETWPEIWLVNEIDLEKAESLIAAAQKPVTGDWFCPSCKENNSGSFEICWQCQTENPSS